MRPGGAVFGRSRTHSRNIVHLPSVGTCVLHAAIIEALHLSAAGSLVGAGGVTAYNAYHSNEWGIVRTLQWWIEKGQADTARANNPDLARLEDMVLPAPLLQV